MAGKWKDTLSKYRVDGKKLEALPAENLDYQKRIDEALVPYRTLELKDLVKHYNKYKDNKDRLEDKVSECNLQIEALSRALMNKMEFMDVEKVTIAGFTFYQQIEPYSQVQDRTKVLDWVKESGQESLLNIQWQTLNSLVKEMMTKAQPPPPGVKVYIKTSIRRRAGKD